MRRTLTTGLVMVCFAIAGSTVASPKGDPAWAAIEKAGRQFAEAFNRGDIAAVANFYTEDAIAFPPDGEMLKGRAAIEALWKGFRETGARSMEFEVLDVVSSGNLAAETGLATLNVQAMGSTPAAVRVKYVVVWRKEGGAWKLYRDIWNAMPAVTPGLTPAAGTAATPAATAKRTPEMPPPNVLTAEPGIPPPTARTPTPHHH